MQNQMPKTLIFVAAAVVTLVLAYWSAPSMKAPAVFEDVGQQFFPEFKAPGQATSLEVVKYNSDSAEVEVFKVQYANGRWTIPSHHNYPADAKDRMAKAAGLFIGLEKIEVRSDSSEDHAALGLLDPSESHLEGGSSGTLVTFRDQSGNELASLIIGNMVEGRPGQHFVREPKRKRSYVAKLAAQLSVDFKDWIETDLLQVSTPDLKQMVFDNYSIDENSGVKIDGDRVVLSQVANQWTMLGLTAEEKIDDRAVSEVTATIDNLKIVGVRPKPAGLSAQLTKNEGVAIDTAALLSLQSRGFYMTQAGALFANEGDLHAKTKKGLVYTLRFGEVTYASGEQLTAGGEAPQPGAETIGEGTASRYLMVTVDLDPSLLDRPAGDPLSQDELDQRSAARRALEELQAAVNKYRMEHGQLPPDLATLSEGEPPLVEAVKPDPWGNSFIFEADAEGGTFTILSYGADLQAGGEGPGMDLSSANLGAEDALRKAREDLDRYTEKLAEGEKLAKQLRERFAPWYYVIDDESFQRLHRDRSRLVAKKDQENQEN